MAIADLDLGLHSGRNSGRNLLRQATQIPSLFRCAGLLTIRCSLLDSLAPARSRGSRIFLRKTEFRLKNRLVLGSFHPLRAPPRLPLRVRVACPRVIDRRRRRIGTALRSGFDFYPQLIARRREFVFPVRAALPLAQQSHRRLRIVAGPRSQLRRTGVARLRRLVKPVPRLLGVEDRAAPPRLRHCHGIARTRVALVRARGVAVRLQTLFRRQHPRQLRRGFRTITGARCGSAAGRGDVTDSSSPPRPPLLLRPCHLSPAPLAPSARAPLQSCRQTARAAPAPAPECRPARH